MPNESGRAYALTTMCPIKNATLTSAAGNREPGKSCTAHTREVLQDLELDERSPLAKVPNTYFCRFYLLTDLMYGGNPNTYDELMSNYLVFTSNFHGELEPYLTGMWTHAEPAVKKIWKHCVAFDRVDNGPRFIEYIKKCQVTTTFFFNGSNDEPLQEQLKALYLKQEFARFALENQGRPAAELQQAFREFAARTQPQNLASPSWRPGQATL